VKDLGEPREAACPEQAKRADGSRFLRRNNRAFGSHPHQTAPAPTGARRSSALSIV